MRSALSPNDRRIADLVVLLDDDREPYAATCRAVGAAAERLGCLRPSYAHVRRLVILHRRAQRLKREGRAVVGDAAALVVAGRVPDLPEVVLHAAGLRSRADFVLQQHKAFGAPPRRGRDGGAAGAGAAAGAGDGGSGGATAPGCRSRAP